MHIILNLSQILFINGFFPKKGWKSKKNIIGPRIKLVQRIIFYIPVTYTYRDLGLA